MKLPNSQLSLVLQKLITEPEPITVGNFMGYPRISEYIRVLRSKYFLDIETIMIKFVTQFGTKSEYASYKLHTDLKSALEVYEKIISK